MVGGGGGFGGDTRIDGLVANSDGTSGREIDLAEGTLEFESSNSANFAVNYDARDHSLNDLVTRINTESSNAGSNIAAEVTPDNRLRIFSANSSPAAALNPGVSNDPDSSFTVNDTGSQQLVNNEGPGAGTTVEVKDASVFQEGDQVRFLDDANSETTTVDAVDTTNDTITVDLSNGYTTANEASVRRVDDQNENRNLLNVLGMDRTYNKDETQTENAISGQFRRPPIEEQVAGLEINESIDNNPSQIAVAKGDDVDSDGIAETSRGKGNNENIFEMNNLRDTKILKRGSKTPDDVISEFVSSVGNEASLVQREKNAAQNLVEDIKQQRQRVSGVSLDEEITKLIRHQQAFQASARVISTVRTTTQSVLQII
ncbi:MAG: flagellar basal body rod C-terminal domain-containing protein [bacterium]